MAEVNLVWVPYSLKIPVRGASALCLSWLRGEVALRLKMELSFCCDVYLRFSFPLKFVGRRFSGFTTFQIKLLSYLLGGGIEIRIVLYQLHVSRALQ